MDKKHLIEFGLTDTEAKIYLVLLEYDFLKAGELVKDTGVQRTTIYHALETLEQKGLVSKLMRSGAWNYSANSPKNIERYLDAQIEEVKRKKLELSAQLPALLSQGRTKSNKFKVIQSEGIHGIKNIIDEALYCHSRKWEIIAPSKNFFSEFDKSYAAYFLKTRLENGIVARSLWESAPGRRVLTEQEMIKRNPRILPSIMHGKFKTVILMFDDKVAFIPSFQEKTVVMIQSQEMHDTMLSVFEGLWVNAKPYKK